MRNLFDEMVLQQQERMLRVAKDVVPSITPDDLMQPNDFPELENYPIFRYEEGILEGLLMARMACLARENELLFAELSKGG